jgi:hypothetical protein
MTYPIVSLSTMAINYSLKRPCKCLISSNLNILLFVVVQLHLSNPNSDTPLPSLSFSTNNTIFFRLVPLGSQFAPRKALLSMLVAVVAPHLSK